MQRGWAEEFEGGQVRGTGVAFVLGEAVAGKLAVQLAQAGGRGGPWPVRMAAAMEKLVASPWMTACCGQSQSMVSRPSMSRKSGLRGKLLDGETHGQQRCVADVDAVDGFGVNGGDGPGDGVGANLNVELVALFFGELLGVGEALAMEAGREDYRCGDDRPEERAAAHLVEAGNAQGAAAARGLFQRPSANRGYGHEFSIERRLRGWWIIATWQPGSAKRVPC